MLRFSGPNRSITRQIKDINETTTFTTTTTTTTMQNQPNWIQLQTTKFQTKKTKILLTEINSHIYKLNRS